MKSLQRLDRQQCGLLVIDLQERLLPAIGDVGRTLWNVSRLLRAAQILNIPSAATVQYPRGLGALDPSLQGAFPHPFEKLSFSAAIEPVQNWRRAHDLGQIVVVGIETHVCVLQTVLDLQAAGADLYVPVDAVAARKELDHRVALERMQANGATLTTVESVIFEWCETAADPNFKLISALIRENQPPTS